MEGPYKLVRRLRRQQGWGLRIQVIGLHHLSRTTQTRSRLSWEFWERDTSLRSLPSATYGKQKPSSVSMSKGKHQTAYIRLFAKRSTKDRIPTRNSIVDAWYETPVKQRDYGAD